MSIHRSMGSVAAVTALALTTLAAPSYAGQVMGTEVQMMNYQFPLSPGQQTLTFNQFDDQGGTRILQSVKIESTTTIQAQVTIENLSVLSAPDAAINLVGTQQLTFPNPGGLPQLTIIGPAVFQTGGLDPSDGTPGSGPDFFDFGLVSDSNMNMQTLSAPGDNLAPFIGLATLDAFVNANGGFSTSGSTDSTLMFSQFMALGEVKITYTYIAQLGACCLAGGVCQDLTQFDCESMGGVYQGDATTCATTTCLNGMIGDFVWSDTNGNGIQDGGEPGIPGVTVNLLDAGMVQIATTMTDGLGAYLFSGLDAGSYTVQFVNPSPATLVESPALQGGDTALDSNCVGGLAAVTLATPNSTDLTIDCGLVPLAGQIGDFVWSDTNGNGIQDGGELGIPGVTVNLLDAGMVQIATTMTDGAGAYLFSGLAAGSYTVQFVEPGGFVESPAFQGGDTALDSNCVGGLAAVTLATPVDVNLTIDCGLTPLSGQIGDFVWSDTNGNG
ncbi:MAG: choice-of-anchor E domain-containing protein, partial [Phycisphaerales bacterium]|nr:choice-of-anchor E domain-containing protein [Phycisphaerales bacterium]